MTERIEVVLEIIEKDPERAMELLNGFSVEERVGLFAGETEKLAYITDWTKRFLEEYLGFFWPKSVLCLGIGGGDELVHLRKRLAAAEIVGMDNQITKHTVFSVHGTRSGFVEGDMGEFDPLETSEILFGSLPDLVLIRNADVLGSGGVSLAIAHWAAVYQNEREKRMILTLAYPDEVEFSENMLRQLSIPYQKSIFPQGHAIRNKKGVDSTTDRNVYIIPKV